MPCTYKMNCWAFQLRCNETAAATALISGGRGDDGQHSEGRAGKEGMLEAEEEGLSNDKSDRIAQEEEQQQQRNILNLNRVCCRGSAVSSASSTSILHIIGIRDAEAMQEQLMIINLPFHTDR